MTEYKVAIPWGSWDFPSGLWHPHRGISMSEDEQFRQNLANGRICKHRFNPRSCLLCKANIRRDETRLVVQSHREAVKNAILKQPFA